MKLKPIFATAVIALIALVGCKSNGGDDDATEENYYNEKYCFNDSITEKCKQTKVWDKRAENVLEHFQAHIQMAMKEFINADPYSMDVAQRQAFQEKAEKAQNDFLKENGKTYLTKMENILTDFDKKLPGVAKTEKLQQLEMMKNQIEQALNSLNNSPAPETVESAPVDTPAIVAE